jgi:hypothetical protein
MKLCFAILKLSLNTFYELGVTFHNWVRNFMGTEIVSEVLTVSGKLLPVLFRSHRKKSIIRKWKVFPN